MRAPLARRPRLWLGLVLLMLVASAAAAEPSKSSAAEVEPPAVSLHELEDATDAGLREVMRLEREIQGASGEHREILVEQQERARASTAEALGQLLQEIARLRDAGADDQSAREKAAAVLDQLARWNEQHEKDLAAELKRLRMARDSASDEDQAGIEKALSETNDRYDRLLAEWTSQCAARERIGLDASAQHVRVDELLRARAEERATQVRVTRKQIADAKTRAASADGEEAKRIQSELARLQSRFDERVASLRQVADLMDARGLPTAPYHELLIEATGEITSDILSQGVALGLAERWFADARKWLVGRAPTLLFKGVVVLVLLFGAHLAGRLLQRAVGRGLQGAKAPVSQLFLDFALSMTYRAALVLGALLVLSQLGVEIGPALAGLGIAGVVIGFALQSTLANFASGMMILAYRPFDIGDLIGAGGVIGKVDQMTLVTTTVLTLDNQRVIIPNAKVWGDVITNITAEKTRRVDLIFGISYSDDLEHAENVLLDIVKKHPKVLHEPAPIVKVQALGESSVNFIVEPWALTVDYWDVHWDVTREVKRRFDAEGISIPFPRRDVHLFGQAESAPGSEEPDGGS